MAAGSLPDNLDELRNDARYERDRLSIYRAKVLGSRPTSLVRLRDLERNAARAEARLAHAVSQQSDNQETS